MSAEQHRYTVDVRWTGNRGEGTRSYGAYGRDHEVRAEGKPAIHGSSDPVFRGDASRYNPEDLLVASVASCHMLWYLHLAADAGVIVTAYEDRPEGTLSLNRGQGSFTEIVLHPQVTVTAQSDAGKAAALHADAHRACFIANSLNFPVRCEPRIVTETP
ncbi:MAG TPA: OsmC family protein [Dyella sp.]|uniref:OsmC family protein n=1 Tax=Dyella sp. TaxID=1869338 RepID=UPI002F93A05D